MKTSAMDVGAIVASIVLCGFAFYVFWQPSGLGGAIEVRVSDADHEYSLRQNQTLEFDGPLGKTRIEIVDGKARFVSSPCSNKYCVLAGWLKSSGDIAVCIPNGISLRVLGGRHFDAINF